MLVVDFMTELDVAPTMAEPPLSDAPSMAKPSAVVLTMVEASTVAPTTAEPPSFLLTASSANPAVDHQ